jgi:hypothetical protein
MGFLSRIPEIEEWLEGAAGEWEALADREYKDLWARWREAFEGPVRARKPTAHGVEAMALLEEELPFSGFLFSAPGSGLLPSQTNPKAPAFAYRIADLARLDRGLLNGQDAIVTDAGFRFTCLYTHEVGSLADPVFLG